MMMGQQHDIDRVVLGDVKRGSRQLGQASVFARRRERGISQPAKTAVLKDCGRSSHELNAELRFTSSGALIGGAVRHPQAS